MSVVPIPDSYWPFEGRLLAGEYPGAPTRTAARAKLAKLLDAGIRTFIDLTEQHEPLEPYAEVLNALASERGIEARHLRFEIPDLGIPAGRERMVAILAAIRDEVATGRPVYVHCWGGIGRTGTVVGCWLVEQGLTGEAALERIADLRQNTPDGWRQSPETEEQRRYICGWRPIASEVVPASPPLSSTLDRYLGALVGLAAGDALGTTLEFQSRGTFTPIDDIVGGGPFGLAPGQWTDDTSMALCLAESLVETGTFDPRDQMTRYVAWWRNGHWSSTGVCFDIGGTVSQALAAFEATGDPMAGRSDPNLAGNGSLMRLAPVPLRYASHPATAVRLAASSSRTTHAAREAVDACRYLAALIVGALKGHDKRDLLDPGFVLEGVSWDDEPLAPAIAAIAAGSFRRKTARDLRASGYVVHTLESALWAWAHSSTFREGALLAVNLGEDADTTGAVYGQLAGTYYGIQGIPDEWRQALARREDVERLAVRLHDDAASEARSPLASLPAL
jgi:ADP-ribosylglycohydrolase/protein-tyrosine phosphatase